MLNENIREIPEFIKYGYRWATRKSSPESKSTGSYGPIVGIPGIGGWIGNGFLNFIHEQNIQSSLLQLGNLTENIDSYLPKIHQEIVSQERRPFVIGISAGGLVALEYCRKYGWDNVQKIITIGTPFYGTGIATYMKPFGKIFSEIERGSTFLSEITNLTPPHDKVISFFAKNDEFTPHPESIKLNWEKVILDEDGHYAMQNNFDWISLPLNHILGVK